MKRSTVAIALTLGASLATAQIASAGGYASNGCVGKKQGALAKYTKSVAKAWDKNPMDSVARDTAIAAAFTKLDATWVKEETKSADKNADCTAATDTSAATATLVNDAIAALAGATEDYGAAAGYVSGAMKARGKYIKDPTKDPAKEKMEAGRGKASDKYLMNASVAVTTGANDLEQALFLATTTSPNYPTTFQSILPGASVNYGKEVLEPTCVDGDPYMFWARKGTSNNVLMYYQGGGACWDVTSCYSVPGGTCKRTATLNDNPDLTGTGFGNYNDPQNPFADWNVVFVSYCSCDVHWGDAHPQDWGPGHDPHFKGRVNAMVAEKFAREHFVDPDKVFVTGSSAGSYGAIMNSYWLMKDVWPNAEFAVLGDAGVGVITQDFLSNYMKNWGTDKNFPEDLPGVTLPIDNLSLVDLIDGLAQAYPTARFANYDSSYDGGSGSQCNFYQVMNNPSPPGNFLTEWGSWWEGACEWNACMRDFKAENATRASNYHYFTGAGSRHTMFGSDKVYTETKSRKSDGTGMTIAQWVNAMVDNTADWVDVDCANPGGDCNLTDSCQGGTNAGGLCTGNADCTTSATCTGGTSPGVPCTTNSDCTGAGGFCPYCQQDPDTANAPFANNNTVTCSGTCPCGPTNGHCGGGGNNGLACTTNADCPDSRCQWVKCPTFTMP